MTLTELTMNLLCQVFKVRSQLNKSAHKVKYTRNVEDDKFYNSLKIKPARFLQNTFYYEKDLSLGKLYLYL